MIRNLPIGPIFLLPWSIAGAKVHIFLDITLHPTVKRVKTTRKEKTSKCVLLRKFSSELEHK